MQQASSRTVVGLLSLIAMSGPLSMQIYLPALPMVTAEFGIPVSLTQLSLSLPILVLAPAVLYYGPKADSVGRRPMLFLSMGLLLAGSLVSWFAANIWILIAGRIVQAVGGAGGIALARAVVVDLVEPDRVAPTFATISMLMMLGPMFAPLTGGYMAEQFGWRSVFALMVVVAAVLLVVIHRFVRESHTPAADPVSARRAYGLLLREPLYIAYTVVGASTVGTYYLFISGAPYVVMDVIGHTPTEYGTYTLTLSAAYFIGNLISVRESSRFGHTRMVVAGSAMALLGAAAMIPMLEWFGWHIESLFAPMAVATIAAGLLIPNAQAGALAVASGGSGAASSLMGFFQQAFGAIMIQTLGLLTLASPMPMAWLMVLMSAVAMVATVYVLRHRGVT